jgi:hypothetical protein
MDWRAIVVLAHVLAAFWYVAGYVGTEPLHEMGPPLDERRRLPRGDPRFRPARPLGDSVGGTCGRPSPGSSRLGSSATALPRPGSWRRSCSSPPCLGGIFFWQRFGGGVEAAAAAGDWTGVRRALNAHWAVVYGRIENLAVLAIIGLMVLRPG